MVEEWLKIKNFNNYEISNLGRIKSFKRYKKGKILKPTTDGYWGYLKIRLYINNIPHSLYIHRLVLETFNPVDNMIDLECNHKNGIKTNNTLINLEWTTSSENIKHAYQTGLMTIIKGDNHYNYGLKLSENTKNLISKNHSNVKGENNPSSILIIQDVIQIKLLLKEGKLIHQEIADIFGVSRTTISNIKNGRTWNHTKLETVND